MISKEEFQELKSNLDHSLHTFGVLNEDALDRIVEHPLPLKPNAQYKETMLYCHVVTHCLQYLLSRMNRAQLEKWIKMILDETEANTRIKDEG